MVDSQGWGGQEMTCGNRGQIGEEMTVGHEENPMQTMGVTRMRQIGLCGEKERRGRGEGRFDDKDSVATVKLISFDGREMV